MDHHSVENWQDKCIRLRGHNGNYISILPCTCRDDHIDCYDLALPSGKVLYCGVPLGLVECFIDELGLEII